MMKVSKLIAGGAAALMLGATGLMSGCDEGAGEPDLPPPPAVEDRNGAQDTGTDPLGPPPAEEPATNGGDRPALPDQDADGDDDNAGGVTY